MSDTRFKKGTSGNPKGRPKGSRGKLSNEALLEEFKKGDAFALKTVKEVMGNNKEKGTTRLRAATAWIGFSLELRKRIEAELLKDEEEEEEVHEFEEDEPLVSLKAIDGGKS